MRGRAGKSVEGKVGRRTLRDGSCAEASSRAPGMQHWRADEQRVGKGTGQELGSSLGRTRSPSSAARPLPELPGAVSAHCTSPTNTHGLTSGCRADDSSEVVGAGLDAA